MVEYGGFDTNSNISINGSNDSVQYCTIRYSSENGIYSSTPNTVIKCNTIEENLYGIYYDSWGTPVISSNNFLNNEKYGVYNARTDITLDASDNWWNDAAGPDKNGDKVYGKVTVEPFLTAKSSCTPPAAETPYEQGYAAGYAAGTASCTGSGDGFSCDIDGNGKQGLPEAVYILQIIAGLRNGGSATKTLTSVSVSGSANPAENSSANYTATAHFSDGTSQDVTGSAVWSENSAFAAFDASVKGKLTTQAVTSNQSVIITASYTYGTVTKSGTLTVTVTDGAAHQMPYIIKNGCTFTLYTVNGTSTVTNISSGGTSVSTSVLQVNDIKFVVQNCVITENSQNIPVYEE